MIFLRIIRFINLLSIDVALGAVCCALFFAKVSQVTVDAVTIVVLGLSVWIIYTADHLLDARRIKTRASSLRHRFHQKYYYNLRICIVATGLFTGVLLFFIPRPILSSGFILAGLVGIYLLIHRYLKMLKEVCIALLYTIGVLLPTWQAVPLHNMPWTLVIAFGLTALLNLILFSWFDHEADRHDGHLSLVIFIGERNTRLCIYLLFVAVLSLLFTAALPIASGIIGIMNVTLLLIFLKREYFTRYERYRLWGDAIFLFPVVYLLL